MNNYFLLLRNESIDFAAFTPDEMAAIIRDFDAWNAEMIGQGQLIVSASLQGGGGKTVRTGPVVADGPYSEAQRGSGGAAADPGCRRRPSGATGRRVPVCAARRQRGSTPSAATGV